MTVLVDFWPDHYTTLLHSTLADIDVSIFFTKRTSFPENEIVLKIRNLPVERLEMSRASFDAESGGYDARAAHFHAFGDYDTRSLVLG
ncbi:unnamed protein product [Euphydryas editha]|uniref:Uncharacterized protein n=1 Tax=Euphydryas editha TaxID=104508 RepID=A0AAU9UVB2_EUPED|nr:unnamed protein product [Euphydryas editha]